MIRLSVTIEEYKPMRLNIVKERVDPKKAVTEIERAIAGAIETAIQDRIDEIMAEAEEAGAETSREVRHG